MDKIIKSIKDAFRKIVSFFKFIISPIGMAVAWAILITFIVILVIVVFKVAGRAITNWLGFANYYETYENDILVIEELQNSGYQYQVDAPNFQNFKAFEYAVLMDVAEYLRGAGYAGFNPMDNQGIFASSKSVYQNSPEFQDAYGKKLAEDAKTTAKIPLLDVATEYDQSKIPDWAYEEALRQAVDARSVNVIDDIWGTRNPTHVLGGNNRVKGPYLVYEFLLNGYNGYASIPKDDEDNSNSTNSQNTAQTQNSSTGSVTNMQNTVIGSANQLLESGDLSGSLIPYVYCIRDEITFTYYFQNDRPITIPLILNAYNNELGASMERSNDISIMTMGVSPVVYPDVKYEEVPYYTDVTEKTIYKIPLETIVGRYMPKQQLMQAWNAMKENIESGDQIVDDILVAIKGVYSEACVLNDNHITKQIGMNSSSIQTQNQNQYEFKGTKNTSKGQTNEVTFVEFQKVGLEQTYYPLVGLRDGGGPSFRYVSEFITAVVVESVRVKVTVYDENDQIIQEAYENLADYLPSGGVVAGTYISAGTSGSGYSPPSDLNQAVNGFYKRGSDVGGVRSMLESAIRNKYRSSGNYVSVSIGNAVHLDHIFLLTTAEPNQTLDVEHMRMPALFVSHVKTWARETEFEHQITMNLFNQNCIYYVIPKSVTSLGIEIFRVKADKKNDYRGAAYEEIMGKMQEKDIVAMLTQLENTAIEGDEDSYEFMRDLYKLVQASKEYSIAQGDNVIHPNTYNYVYIPDSILYYNDIDTQKIYWLNLIAQRGEGDEITQEELEQMRTKDLDITWQIVDYEKFEECDGKVYALYPFGSEFVRSYYEGVFEAYRKEYERNRRTS